MLTYRVLVTGKFDRPDEETRARLLAELDKDGFPQLKFTEEGSLAYSEHLGSFSFRCVVLAKPGSGADQDAKDQAELMAMERLDSLGYPYRDVTSAPTCMDTIKINRKR
ncbi:DUF6204 family protein [Amycolatopsis sp. CA-230715]|uniref:DUF6204 family protein n=1 Tax=Amycolatopsis sp. CA-230715 TaxID=2745196 RepID=UPI001C025C0F|nr:DUF6204 family protein [Amycolatopsis sp. CA-230715]QWF79831.1 hypothetical protein HUW46_03244 [Amycolatopsis sp. CA-230715]